MKKVLLALSMLAGVASYAQYQVSGSNLNLEPASQKQKAAIEKAIAKKNADHASKKSGGPVSQRMSHSDLVAQVFGGYNQGTIGLFIQPVFQDSTVMQDFSGPDNINIHSGGQTFDLTQSLFKTVLGQEPFSANDSYTVDSLWIGGVYDIITPTANQYTGDTIVIEIVVATPSDPDAWGPVYFPAGTFPGQTNDIFPLPLAYDGLNAHGYQGGATYPQKITVKRALTVSDSAITNNDSYLPIDLGQTISVPAGSRFSVSATFKAGYSYNPGDIYFASSASTSTSTLNNFRFLLAAAEDANDDNPYFIEELGIGSPSDAISSLLFTNTRYKLYTGTSAFRNETFSAGPGYGLLFDIKATGNSTFSVNEQNLENAIALYPNPTSGNVTLEIAQGGTYSIDVLNLVGQTVHSEQVTINGGEKLNRDFSNLNKGVYLINLNGEGISKTSKLTIK